MLLNPDDFIKFLANLVLSILRDVIAKTCTESIYRTKYLPTSRRNSKLVLNSMKQIISIGILVMILIVGIFYIWNNINIGLNKELLLQRNFNEFSSMISVNLCQEAYDKFITSNSKEEKGDNFFSHCKGRKENWSNIKITNIVFSNNKRADIRYSFDQSVPNFQSKEYKDCLNILSFRSCEGVAPKEIEHRSSIETWIYESRFWKRDY